MFGKVRITDLTYKEVSTGLSLLGFIHKRTTASHEQWIGYRDGRKYVVTVDKPQSPFHIKLIESMAQQSGIHKKQFYLLCKGKIEVDKHLHLCVVGEPVT